MYFLYVSNKGGKLCYELPVHTYTLPLSYEQPAEIHSELTCYYYDAGRNPRLVIRPIKLEVVYPDPKIYVFREILTDQEMKRLKDLGEPVLRRATTLNRKSGQRFAPVSYRIGKRWEIHKLTIHKNFLFFIFFSK